MDVRCSELRTHAPNWHTMRGCSACCEQLSELPRIARTVWELLRERIDVLEPALRRQVWQRLEQCSTEDTTPSQQPLSWLTDRHGAPDLRLHFWSSDAQRMRAQCWRKQREISRLIVPIRITERPLDRRNVRTGTSAREAFGAFCQSLKGSTLIRAFWVPSSLCFARAV